MIVSTKDKLNLTRKRRPFRRLHDPTKARGDDVYTIKEVANLYQVDEQTVYNWIREGLRPVANATRLLIRGTTLNRFHAARNERARRPMTETQFLCLHCHIASEPAPGSVIGATTPLPSLRMEARCSTCDQPMYRAWSRSSAAALQGLTNLCAAPPGIPREVFANTYEKTEKTTQIETACDSVIQRPALGATPSKKTPEGPSNTNESNQIPLPFEF
jgi:hypothetical protein